MDEWSELRRDFPALKTYRYFLTASGGPLPISVYEAAADYYRDSLNHGDLGWDRNIERREAIRTRAAEFINASPEEVEFIPSTAAGMNMVADLLGVSGDVLATPLEFPDTTLPWLHRRPDSIRWIDPDASGAVPVERYSAAMTEQTSVLATSHVQYSNGFRQDLERLGAVKGTHRLVVNATQSLGAFRVDVRSMKIDALCANSYKWMLAGYGCGLLFISKHLPGQPRWSGWFAVRERDALRNDRFQFLETAARFNPGSPSFPTIFALGAAIDYLSAIGLERIEARVLELNRYLTDSLVRAGFEVLSPLGNESHRSAQTLVRLNRPGEVVRALAERNILCTEKPQGMRVATHFFVTQEDIDVLVSALKEIEPAKSHA